MSNVRRQPTRLILLSWVALTILLSLTQTAFTYQTETKQSFGTLKDNKLAQTAFTYLGKLKEGGLADGTYTFRFALHTGQSGGQTLRIVVKDDVVVTNGSFTLQLDFGSDGFGKNESWLEVGVRPANGADSYKRLSPRQQLTPTRFESPAQAEPWSLSGVPLSFSRADTDPAPVDGISDQPVTSQKLADGQAVKRIDFVKDPVGVGAGNNATVRPSGSTLALAPQESGAWTRAGRTVLLATDAGNVGIGTSKPVAKLDVAGTIHASEAVTVGNSVGLLSSGSLNLIEVDNSNPLAIGFSNPMAVNPNPVTFQNIKVGIGTKTPSQNLTVFRAAAPGPVIGIGSATAFGRIAIATCAGCYSATANPDDFVLGNDGLNVRDLVLTSRSDNPSGGAIRFATGTISGVNDTEKMRITKAGNVGIGTTSPTNTLDVNGQARIRVLTPSPLLNDVVVADANGVLFKRPASTLGGGGNFWSLTGNAATPGNFLGTTVNVPLEIRVNNSRAFLIEYHPQAPNIIGGSPANSVTAGVGGATIAGGGFAGMGGHGNTVTANFGTVGGGRKNQSGNLATVGGGYNNTASGPNSTVGGGANNTASGSIATVPGGSVNTASGNVSFAAGCQAQANHNGAFVWADVLGCGNPFASTANDQFNVRASGGTRIFSNFGATVGVQVAPGGNAWSALSDRNVKENFVPVNGRLILQKLSFIPITEWNLKSQDSSVRHIGPMAQDFYASFRLGESDRHISTSDADGITLISIQALYQMSLEKDQKIEELQQRIEKLEKLVGTLIKK